MVAFLLLLAFLPVLAGLFYLWGIVRMWRTDPTLAIVMFFLWPASIYALVRHWGQKENDIRLPLFGSFALFALWGVLLALAGNAPRNEPRNASVPSAIEEPQKPEDPAAERLRFGIALAKAPFRSGQVDLPAAHATLEVPTHFHFYDRASLDALYAESEEGPGEATVGWLVHESVNLADDDAWYVDVAWIGEGFVAEGDIATHAPDALLADGRRVTEQQSALLEDGSSFSLVRYAETPTLDTPLHRATWVEEYAYKEKGVVENKLDCYAIKLGRGGAILYSINEIDTQRQELCLRSVRLASTRTTFSTGQTYDDHSGLLDHRAKFDLPALITGTLPPRR